MRGEEQMKKTYMNPQLECVRIASDDVITTSNSLTELDWALGEQISR